MHRHERSPWRQSRRDPAWADTTMVRTQRSHAAPLHDALNDIGETLAYPYNTDRTHHQFTPSLVPTQRLPFEFSSTTELGYSIWLILPWRLYHIG